MKLITICFMALVTTIVVAQENNFSSTEIVVELKADYTAKIFCKDSRVKQINDSLNLKSYTVVGNKKLKRTYLLKFKNEVDVKSVIEVYKRTNAFRFVEPNFIGNGHGVMQTSPNDSNFFRQWSHVNNASFTLSAASNDADIDTDLAWDITQGDPNLIVAVLDSGLRMNHPEFAGRLVPGFDFANNDPDPIDDHGHGTNVAGIILAKGDNSIGYAGVNWNSKIMICKILNSQNQGYYSWWADGIYYAVDNGAKVINMSVGGASSSTLLEDAINYAFSNGVSVTVSSGNQNSVIQYPAQYANAIAVGSTNPNDTRTSPFFWDVNSGSNFGAELDFVAPGNYIYGLSYNSDTYYNSYWGGTSQAAPMVAGVISLMLSVNPALTPTQIRQILEQTSEDQVGDAFDTPGWDQYYGHGRINAFAALSSPLLSNTKYYTESSSIKIFPNPISTENIFSINGLNPSDHYDLKVVSLEGKVVKELKNKMSEDISKIEVSNMQSGIYFVNISNLDNQLVFNKKIIKK